MSDDPKPTLLDLPEDWETAPDVEISCWHCGRKLKHNKHLALIFPRTTCDACCEAFNREQRSPAQKLALEEKEAAVIPPLYRSTELDKLPYPEQAEDILAWQFGEGVPGLWVLGDTRTGKTRALCLLVSRLLAEGVKVRAFFHGSFADEMLETIRSDRNFRQWKNKIAAEPLVFIDDVFAEKLTERSESALFEVLDARLANLRPTLCSTQVTAEEARKRFHSAKRCEAFFARIREFFHLVNLGDTQTALPLDK